MKEDDKHVGKVTVGEQCQCTKSGSGSAFQEPAAELLSHSGVTTTALKRDSASSCTNVSSTSTPTGSISIHSRLFTLHFLSHSSPYTHLTPFRCYCHFHCHRRRHRYLDPSHFCPGSVLISSSPANNHLPLLAPSAIIGKDREPHHQAH